MTPDEQFADLTGHLVQLMERMSDLTEAHHATEREMKDLVVAQKDLTAAQKVTEMRMAQALELHVRLGNIVAAHDASLENHADRLDKLEGNA